MKLMFLGTGAADYDWSKYGEEGIAGSTVSLLEEHILLDCGPTAKAAMERFGVNPEQIDCIVNTHSHSDHFDLDNIRNVASGRKIDFYGSAQACGKVADFCNVHVITYGDEFTVNDCSFLVLPANHVVEDIREETFNYLISCNGKTLLYALDTAWMLSKARRLIGRKHIDAIIWDTTMSQPDNWRIFEHSDPVMFAAIRRVLQQTGNITEDVKVWFDHRARTLWPTDPAEQEAVARRENVMLAHEGESVII
ncbi:MAG: MBL fold metallo-hydrolase [Lentisphaerae bacterium]|nr:MBL fold metallo-hydrolase [Lentisphaerota bacterium]